MAYIGCPACNRSIDSTATTCPHCQADVAAARRAVAEATVTTELSLTQGMTDAQRQLFLAEMALKRKDKTTARLLALLLGGLGAHHFYLRSYIAGVVYVLFCWTYIPMILGVIECFIVGGRVDRFNLQQAQLIAARIRVLGTTVTT